MDKNTPCPLLLEDFLPYQLSVLTNKISQKLADYYSRQFALTTLEWRVMAVLGEFDGLSAVQIAQRTEMDKVAVSRAIAGLLDKGYVTRRFLVKDKRCSVVRLSKAGNKTYQLIVPRALAYQMGLMSVLSPEEKVVLQAIIGKLSACIDTQDWQRGILM